MKLTYLILLATLFFPFYSFSQVNDASCWEASSHYNCGGSTTNYYYKLLIKKDSITIFANGYSDTYKLKKGKFFKIGDEQFMLVNEEKNKIYIRYHHEITRIAVNDIINVDFQRCK